MPQTLYQRRVSERASEKLCYVSRFPVVIILEENREGNTVEYAPSYREHAHVAPSKKHTHIQKLNVKRGRFKVLNVNLSSIGQYSGSYIRRKHESVELKSSIVLCLDM